MSTDDTLTTVRRRADYSLAERAFSEHLQYSLRRLLQGRLNRLCLLRHYPQDTDRIGISRLPDGLPKTGLRQSVVEHLVWETIRFVRSEGEGGPVSQVTTPGGYLEYQAFPTKYPHIIIERSDRYDGDGEEPVEITWSLRRLQNQRSQTQINRMLDAANLAFELVRMVR